MRFSQHKVTLNRGILFLSKIDKVELELIEKNKTKTGLKVVARIHLKDYPIGIKTLKSEIDFSRIQFNQQIPKLSYRIAA